MLWFALIFPRLPLEAQALRPAPTLPMAVAESGTLCCVSQAAAQGGVTPGLGLPAAQALLPGLRLLERNPVAEQQALRRLADWSLQYTSHASLHPPDCLLLEIRGSLRLFGGLDALLRHVRNELDALGYDWLAGTAPTPLAAWLLARSGDPEPALSQEEFRQRLTDLPVRLLPLHVSQQQALEGLGIHTLQQLLALPSRDLGPRLGRAPMQLLERALGQLPDPRPAHRPRKTYHGELELPAPAHTSEAILFALQRLIRELAGLLRGLEAGVQRLELLLAHRNHPPTRLQPGLMQPSREADHLLMICRERLERQPLPAPVVRITLHAGRLLPLAPEALALLDARIEEQQQRWLRLTERLEARLGEQCVLGLDTHPDHRPEHAWRGIRPGGESIQKANPHRPLWLLAPPRPLHTEQGQPCWQGPLALCQGPERIESGWWDGHDVSRDYYRARSPCGALLWIYRERR
ncbi:MAG: DNA polymerase Y family protein [Ectothiorhodospiraceae bacterium]|nr:DNA polymerase Y family protein [Ectothiorhodospiraceae bacterium]